MTLEQRNQQLATIMDQQRELLKQSNEGESIMLATVTCPCGRCRSITHAVRCLYCSIWYCEPCAEAHFGQTREEYRTQNPVMEAERT